MFPATVPYHRLAAGLAVVLAFAPPPARGQARPLTTPEARRPAKAPDVETSSPRPFSQTVSLPTDSTLKKKLDAVRDYVADQAWAEATTLLQALLDGPEDAFVAVTRKDAGGKETVRWVSVRGEANRILGELPVPGLEVYELTHGPRARGLLAEARKANDLAPLARLAQQYLHTQAGAEALDHIGTYYLDRGQALMAAGCYERLLQRPRAAQLPALVLFKAALAFDRAGDKDGADQAWKLLAARAPDGLKLGSRQVGLDELHKQLGKVGTTPVAALGADWPMFRGDATRSLKARGGEPGSGVKWTQRAAHDSVTAAWVQAALQLQELRAQPALPGGFPIAVADRVVFRSYRGVQALDRQTGKPVWESRSDRSLDGLAQDSGALAYASSWVNTYLGSSPHVLFENSVLGTLSSDGSRVYAVDDLAVPPYPRNAGLVAPSSDDEKFPLSPDLTEAARGSRLIALDLDGGKVVWEVGGGEADAKDRALHECFFLGPPLPLGGRLYVLVEKKQEVRLACLAPATGAVLWQQTLALPYRGVRVDPVRRLHAAHPACGESILVCPTNAGALVAVDLHSQGLLWAYAYREEPVERPDASRRAALARLTQPLVGAPNFQAVWKASAPIVHNGRVIFTAPDAASMQCLNLRDGAVVWRANRKDNDLYLAGVFGERVLVVGKHECRALSLADGRELWGVDTGLPSGQGVAAGKVYYLPVKAPIRGSDPAILAIDVEKGAVAGRTRFGKQEAPGNLVLGPGVVFSQTPGALTAYAAEKRE